MNSRKTLLLACTALALLVALAGCNQPNKQDAPLRVAVLPILDSLPLYVAEAEGYFQDENITIELITVSSAAERDQLLQADQVDVLITDLVALALANRDQSELVAIRYAMLPTPQFAQFRILSAPEAGIESVQDLAQVPVGISEGTVIEYVTDRLLSRAGLPTTSIETVAVPKVPDRMTLLAAGELSAATLPEPSGSLALQEGAHLVIDDTSYTEVSCSIFAVRAEVLDDRAETMRGFVRAINRASVAINDDKTAWSDLLAEGQLVPPAIGSTYSLPDYPPAAVPTAAQVADVADWLNQTGRLAETAPYKQIVTEAFLQ